MIELKIESTNKKYIASNVLYGYIQEVRGTLNMLEYNYIERFVETIIGPRISMSVNDAKGNFMFIIQLCFSNNNLNYIHWSHFRIMRGDKIIKKTFEKERWVIMLNECIKMYEESGKVS